MRGDLLFYTPKDWIGSIVAWSTNGPFSHVAIDMGDGTKIEADWNGIVRVKTINRAIAARFETGNIVPKLDDGMKWVQDQLGNPYGKEDILNQVLRLIGLKLYFGEPKRYDCSDLAARFLVHSGLGTLLGPDEDNIHLITPNSLARRLGVHI